MNRYTYQNLPQRIAKLKAHLKTRRGRRDLVALGTLADIQAELAAVQGRRLTCDKMNAMMKCYYTETEAALKHYAEHPVFAMLKKDKP